MRPKIWPVMFIISVVLSIALVYRFMKEPDLFFVLLMVPLVGCLFYGVWEIRKIEKDW